MIGSMLETDLIALGYLAPGESLTRAVTRFQRHAKRTYRKTAAGGSLKETPVFTGAVDGIPGPITLGEIARWLQLGYRLPLGYFQLAPIGTWGRLREDTAAEWIALMAAIRDIGGTIDGPYGDTERPLMKTISAGASKYSFHMCGRAVDLNQGLGNSRYFPVREPRGSRTYWRIYCQTLDQSGAQGEEPSAIAFHNFATHSDDPLPDGYYVDLTAEIERGGLFERIAAQAGWEHDTRMSEWWHFQWVPEKQQTFQDECELIGIAEQQLRAFGYADADLDHPPG
jgi:hypothetical protein